MDLNAEVDQLVRTSQTWIPLIMEYGSRLALALITLAIGWWLINKVTAKLGKLLALRNADTALQGFISTLANIILKILLFVSVASMIGVATTSVVAAIGAAGLAIGLAGWQLYGDVLLPQALKRMTPPTINVYTRIIKTSSLAVLIGVVDVIKVGQQIIERTYESVLIYGALFLFFFLICYPLSAASRALERRWTHA